MSKEISKLAYPAFLGGLLGQVTYDLVSEAVKPALEKKDLMKIKVFKSRKTIAPSTSLTPGSSDTPISNVNMFFGVILIHGDGDSDVTVTISGATTRSCNGDEQAIDLVANETITITRTNNATTSKTAPTIEVAYIYL